MLIAQRPEKLPIGETMTGCCRRHSPGGGTLIIIVSTEPRLVPTQRVGNVVGSENFNISLNQNYK